MALLVNLSLGLFTKVIEMLYRYLVHAWLTGLYEYITHHFSLAYCSVAVCV